jgi:2-succinyl-5-enolpyruvyl-6-hydroxy-3-cyclohexene-1-carboxylate synthase
MARELNTPVALICTSGTALLNYAPAITEAYYQDVPVVAITADRPAYLIDQEDGQSIHQHNIFANHICYSTTLPFVDDNDGMNEAKREIKQALDSLKKCNRPVHINIPFEEPLYDTEDVVVNSRLNLFDNVEQPLTNYKQLDVLADIINSNKRVMLLAGVMLPDKELSRVVNRLSNDKNILVIAPPTSNIDADNILNTPDLLIKTLSQSDTNFEPDILITIGGSIVSKVMKQYLRSLDKLVHIDIDINTTKVDTYNSLKDKIDIAPKIALDYLYNKIDTISTEFRNLWLNRGKQTNSIFKNLIDKIGWCDIAVLHNLLDSVNSEVDIHLANSTPVRYMEFFRKNSLVNYYCNRGTSGIDGSVSTSAGAALVNNRTTVMVTGDISFVYDSNAFWNRYVPKNLKIILINNGGGNIFKIIPGPKTTAQLEEFFETSQNVDNAMLCRAFGIDYYTAQDNKEFKNIIGEIFNNNKCSVVEVFTDSEINAKVFTELSTILQSL